MKRALAVLALSGCVSTVSPPADPPAVVAPLETMAFPFPFRGITYRMVIADGQGIAPAAMTLTTDQPVDQTLAKTAAANACAFIGRFPVDAMVGVAADGGNVWTFDASCL